MNDQVVRTQAINEAICDFQNLSFLQRDTVMAFSRAKGKRIAVTDIPKDTILPLLSQGIIAYVDMTADGDSVYQLTGHGQNLAYWGGTYSDPFPVGSVPNDR